MKVKVWIVILQLLGSVVANLEAEETRTIALLDFALPGAESNRWAWAQTGLADLLQIELQQQGLVLLDRDLIHAVLSEQRMTAGGVTAGAHLGLGRLLNAQFLISGRLAQLADGRFQIVSETFSVEAVETKGAVKAEGVFPKDLPAVIQNIARQISSQFPSGNTTSNGPKQKVYAPKPESLIMFYRGLNACVAGKPQQGAACFINAASLDPGFAVPLLWEIKAYEMAGLTPHASIRRKELTDILEPLGLAEGATNSARTSSQSVIAVLNPVVNVGGAVDVVSLADDLKRALLSENQVRVFAYEGIGAAVAEQDLRLSSFFANQNGPLYGRWLTADGLLLCRISSAESNLVSVELSLVDPLNATAMGRVHRTVPLDTLRKEIPASLKELITGWLNQTKPITALPVSEETSVFEVESPSSDLRPIYHNFVNAILQLHRMPEKGDSHRALADAFAAVDRSGLAAYEIEQCLKLLDIHAPDADGLFYGTHRWLFWSGSPASGVVGLLDKKLIDRMIEQLLTNYPRSLAAGCMRYNLAVTAWRRKNWPEAITQAQQSREILRALIANYDRQGKTRVNRGDSECEITAATYFLEGSSLRESGQREQAVSVLRQGLDFMKSFDVRNYCLPYGPALGNVFGPQRVYGYGGDPPGIRTRLEQQLVELGVDVKREPVAPTAIARTKDSGISTKSSAYWLMQGELEVNKNDYHKALSAYHQAVVTGASVSQCSGLATALLEIALEQGRDHPQEEVEKIRQHMGFSPVQVSWVEWFSAARKYHRRSEYEKAAACYRGALKFLEYPEEGGIYHLDRQPNSDRVALRMESSLVDFMWSDKYFARWCSAAFYLAQCLICVDRKEEAAQWLRQVAIKVGGDDSLLLLISDGWSSSAACSGKIGARAAELLQQLHAQSGAPGASK